MKVRNFIYNGLFVKIKEGLTKYTEFKKWKEDDVGIAICNCSDGKERPIPTCALVGYKSENFPKHEVPEIVKQTTKNYLVHFGIGCCS